MRPISVLSLAVLAGSSLAGSIRHVKSEIQGRGVLALTEEDVDTLDLYASYSASAPCNIRTPIGEPVTCYKNCDRVEDDGAIILNTFHGEITEFAAYMAVVKSREQIVWVGRGSATKQNWCTSFNFTLIPNDLVDGGQVHAGFQTAWSEISDQVLSTLADAVAEYPEYSIVVTGGSLGGAVATLAAANFWAAGYDADLYTYGAPKVGNGVLSDFISNHSGKFYRVTHNQDVVPRLPFTDLFPNYKHTSPEYWLTGKPADPDHWPIEDIKICEGNSNRECIDNPWNGWDWTFGDHQNYFGSLECWNSDTSGSSGLYISDDIQNHVQRLVEKGGTNSLVEGDIELPFLCNYKS